MPEPAARPDPGRTPWPSSLAPLSALYGGAVAMRGWLYDRGWLAARELGVPVVSVGNLTVGGTGKSPMVAYLARLLLARGARPAIVSRGYGGTRAGAPRVVSEGRAGAPLLDARQAGDEPVMLARLLDDVPVIVSPRRLDGGRLAVSRFGATCVILDDGFQHRALARRLDLLLLDGVEPLGNGRLLPAGPLREPVRATKRAGAIVVTRADFATPAALAEIDRMTRRYCPDAPVFRARSRPVGLVGVSGEDGPVPIERLDGARVVCFAGIANPDRFFQLVIAAGATVEAALPFADHHWFTVADLARVKAASVRADLIVTTEKDAARLVCDGGFGSRGSHVGRGEVPLERLYALRVETILEDERGFAALLERSVPCRS